MVRETIDISGIWRFQPDPMNDGEGLGYASLTRTTAAGRRRGFPPVSIRRMRTLLSTRAESGTAQRLWYRGTGGVAAWSLRFTEPTTERASG